MPTSSTSDLTQKSLKISTTDPKDHSKDFSKLTRSELSMANKNLSSFEDYYYQGESSVSVPFMWESQPGTPKVKYFRENPNHMPPLTPPPSYCYSPVTNTSSPSPKSIPNKAHFLQAIFPNKQYAGRRNKRFSPSPSLSPSSSSSLSSSPRSTLYSSVPSSPAPAVCKTPPSLKSRGRRRNIISSPRLSVDSRAGDLDRDHDEYGSPVSTLCFGRSGVNARSRPGCYSSLIKKKLQMVN